MHLGSKSWAQAVKAFALQCVCKMAVQPLFYWFRCLKPCSYKVEGPADLEQPFLGLGEAQSQCSGWAVQGEAGWTHLDGFLQFPSWVCSSGAATKIFILCKQDRWCWLYSLLGGGISGVTCIFGRDSLQKACCGSPALLSWSLVSNDWSRMDSWR